MSFLKRSRRREFYTMEWRLDTGGSVNVSAKLYGICL